MADIELVIKIDEDIYNHIKERYMYSCATDNTTELNKVGIAVRDGTPLEEIPNPCIECSQNYCVCELNGNGEKCECQKVYVVKENKE